MQDFHPRAKSDQTRATAPKLPSSPDVQRSGRVVCRASSPPDRRQRVRGELHKVSPGDCTKAPEDCTKTRGEPQNRCRGPQRSTQQRPRTAKKSPGTARKLPGTAQLLSCQGLHASGRKLQKNSRGFLPGSVNIPCFPRVANVSVTVCAVHNFCIFWGVAGAGPCVEIGLVNIQLHKISSGNNSPFATDVVDVFHVHPSTFSSIAAQMWNHGHSLQGPSRMTSSAMCRFPHPE